MLDRLSPLQRHCLAALEVECYHWRQPSGATVSRPSPATPASAVEPTGPLCLVADAAEAGSPLVRALARALDAQVAPADQGGSSGAVLVSLGAVAATAALSLPALAVLRADPQAKRRSWLKIRSFLSLRRTTRE